MSMLKDDWIYSYSQLSAFDECPFSFYLERIEKGNEKLSNAFAERGSLIHDILDKWAKNELTKPQMLEEYESRYGTEVVTQFPRMLAAKGYTEKAYKIGQDYFKNFDEFEGYEIVASEEKFKIDLELADGTTRPFIGIIDMVLRKVDDLNGGLIICDHKSKSWSSFKKAEKSMYRQPLIYAAYVKQKYGEYPKTIMFNLFNEMGDKASKPFTIEDYNEAINWATDCIHQIEEYDLLDWLTSKTEPDFFCESLCASRGSCSIGNKPKTRKNKIK